MVEEKRTEIPQTSVKLETSKFLTTALPGGQFVGGGAGEGMSIIPGSPRPGGSVPVISPISVRGTGGGGGGGRGSSGAAPTPQPTGPSAADLAADRTIIDRERARTILDARKTFQADIRTATDQNERNIAVDILNQKIARADIAAQAARERSGISIVTETPSRGEGVQIVAGGRETAVARAIRSGFIVNVTSPEIVPGTTGGKGGQGPFLTGVQALRDSGEIVPGRTGGPGTQGQPIKTFDRKFFLPSAQKLIGELKKRGEEERKKTEKTKLKTVEGTPFIDTEGVIPILKLKDKISRGVTPRELAAEVGAGIFIRAPKGLGLFVEKQVEKTGFKEAKLKTVEGTPFIDTKGPIPILTRKDRREGTISITPKTIGGAVSLGASIGLLTLTPAPLLIGGGGSVLTAPKGTVTTEERIEGGLVAGFGVFQAGIGIKRAITQPAKTIRIGGKAKLNIGAAQTIESKGLAQQSQLSIKAVREGQEFVTLTKADLLRYKLPNLTTQVKSGKIVLQPKKAFERFIKSKTIKVSTTKRQVFNFFTPGAAEPESFRKVVKEGLLKPKKIITVNGKIIGEPTIIQIKEGAKQFKVVSLAGETELITAKNFDKLTPKLKEQVRLALESKLNRAIPKKAVRNLLKDTKISISSVKTQRLAKVRVNDVAGTGQISLRKGARGLEFDIQVSPGQRFAGDLEIKAAKLGRTIQRGETASLLQRKATIPSEITGGKPVDVFTGRTVTTDVTLPSVSGIRRAPPQVISEVSFVEGTENILNLGSARAQIITQQISKQQTQQTLSATTKGLLKQIPKPQISPIKILPPPPTVAPVAAIITPATETIVKTTEIPATKFFPGAVPFTTTQSAFAGPTLAPLEDSQFISPAPPGTLLRVRSIQVPISNQISQQKIQTKLQTKQQARVLQQVKVQQKSQQKILQQQKLLQKQKLLQQQKQQLKLRTIFSQTLKSGNIIKPPGPPPPPQIPIIGGPDDLFSTPRKVMVSRKTMEAFEVFIRRGGVFRKISKRPLPKGLALQLGAKRALTTLASTVQLRRKGTTTKKDIKFKIPTDKFRKPKSGEKLTFVEKKQFRIKRGSGEISEILKVRKGKTRGKGKKRRKK